MPPRIPLASASRALPLRPRAAAPRRCEKIVQPIFRRGYADAEDKDVPKAPPGQKGMNQDTLPHVSEESAAMGKITGVGGAELEQGTPIGEVVKGDKEAQDKLPKVMQDVGKTPDPSGKRSFSTSARRSMSLEEEGTGIIESPPPTSTPQIPGVNFALPAQPLTKQSNFKRRYDTVVDQVTNLLMRDGQKSVAQRNMAHILSVLRTSPPPIINPARPLVPGAPPPSHLPLNPVLYLTLAIDSVAPLLRLRSIRGAAGGGVALQLPQPLNVRQRRRTSTMWILEAASKKRNRSSGRYTFAQRVAEEMIAIVEGKSPVWERRNGLHKLGVAARANITIMQRKR